MAGLREMLMGPPLNARDDDDGTTPDLTRLNLEAHVAGLDELMGTVYGDTPACTQARTELGRVLKATEPEAVHGQRALLLFALHREPEVRAALAGDTFTADMVERVLPFVTPRFFRHGCQAPDAYVTLCMVLNEMWLGEKLGNWPRAGGNSGAPRSCRSAAAPAS